MLSLLLCLVFGLGLLSAKSFAPFSTDCDTLITHEGTSISVVVVQSTLDSIFYRDCGDSNGQVKQMSRRDFRMIRFNEQTNRLSSGIPDGALRLDEALYKHPRLAKIGLGLWLFGIFFAVLAYFTYFLFTLFSFLGLSLVLAGTICSIVFLKGTRKSKNLYRTQRKIAKVGAVLGLVLSAILLLFAALIIYFLIIFG